MLSVSEIFYSIQGEGDTAGRPAIFIRLSGCNLDCRFCDTNIGIFNDKDLTTDEIMEILKSMAIPSNSILVITGGEPLLQQEGIIDFLACLDGIYKIEIETNVTVPLCPYILNHTFIKINASPKLSNCGCYEYYTPRIVKQLVDRGNTIFKFVVENEKDVLEAIDKYIKPYQIPENTVWLMPMATDRKILTNISLKIVEVCKKYGFNFSTRLQISLWNNKTGV